MATRSWNRVELIGNLTKDPEMRFTPSGSAVATYSIATNRTYVVEGEKKEEVDYHRIVAWGKLAELCNQLLKKGNRVFVSGRLQNRTWEGQDGQQRNTTEIVLEDMILLTSRSGESNEDSFAPAAAEFGPSRDAEETPAPAKSAKSSKNNTEAHEDVAKAPKEDVDVEDLPF